MQKTVIRGLVASALAGAAVFGAAAPALAAPAPGEVAVVDEPDTTNLNNAYTFAPLGVPVIGLVRSVNAAPGKLLPSFG
ncbi:MULTISPECIES: hypothetical protein [Amycolatopsis]|uniref:Secreted protein n=1 Tax=Amycolatopsis viridis TaxID=185678 RepID=A0ABX0SMX1_9PSEU|nr:MULTISPECIES: hypothetical protein [Amycolatopsis]NIH77955.1 hypothetical protein [Amycolatopsis viridis]NIH86571.1 hypothetical protein [Amycolatopsis granulosa]